MTQSLQYYVACFNDLNCNKRSGETAPHKAVLLLAVMEEIRLGHITNGFIPLNEQMVAAFYHEWRKYVGDSELFNPVFETPFFHLDYEPFWELMKKDPFLIRREYSLNQLRANFYGAKIPEDLCGYMANEASRILLKRALIEKYLPDCSSEREFDIAAEFWEEYGKGDGVEVNTVNRA